ncbi:transmembrane protein 95 isoform X2 [Ailuropoda melanoleuca]|uniref:transmembrane protein 95 isoform X2 n=1 Tax=Ailuropoda melanoleuca TaxID=9646 RepID=UPI001494E441|nr:transmembrane protein 95 isoform X2 [Ailuropoda melanoleuca]
MWVLALGGVFLATAQGCVLCHLPARDLSGRLAQLCSQVEVLWKNCGASWSFPAFALGKLRRPGTGRATVATAPGVGQPVASQPGPSVAPSVHSPPGTHRPLPVGELLQALGRSGKNHRSLPVSADEASMNKVIEKTHRVLRVMEIKGSPSSLRLYWHWLQHTRLPAYTREALCAPACRSHDLREARILLLSVLVAALLLGVMSLVVESRYHLEAKRTSEDTDNLLAAGSRDYEPITSTSSEGISQPLSSSPKGSGFQSPSPEVPTIPASEGRQGPRRPQLGSSSPPALN